MNEASQHSDVVPHAAAEPWVSEPQYRQGVVDLLGILAYGALAAFDRLAEDARRAPTLADKVFVASLAALQIKHFDTVRARLGGLEVDVMVAMEPFHAPFDEFHAQTKPKDWLEGLVLAYVGNGFAADFYREVAAFVDTDTRALVHQVLADEGHADFAIEEVRAAIAADPPRSRPVGALGAPPGWGGPEPGSAGRRGPGGPDSPADRDRRPSRHGPRSDQPDVLTTGREPHPPHGQTRPPGLSCHAVCSNVIGERLVDCDRKRPRFALKWGGFDACDHKRPT